VTHHSKKKFKNFQFNRIGSETAFFVLENWFKLVVVVVFHLSLLLVVPKLEEPKKHRQGALASAGLPPVASTIKVLHDCKLRFSLERNLGL
jgi:hypothetical protein